MQYMIQTLGCYGVIRNKSSLLYQHSCAFRIWKVSCYLLDFRGSFSPCLLQF